MQRTRFISSGKSWVSAFAGALVVLVPASAMADGGWRHEYYSRYRPSYGSQLYFGQQVNYHLSRQDVTERPGSPLPVNNSSASSGEYSGYSLQSSVGLEHFRFLQTGLTYSLVEEHDRANLRNEVRAHELGLEGKVVLQSPVVNLALGGSLFGADVSLITESNRFSLKGTGYSGSADLIYCASSRLHFLVSARRVIQTVNDKSTRGAVQSLQSSSTRAGVGFNIWL